MNLLGGILKVYFIAMMVLAVYFVYASWTPALFKMKLYSMSQQVTSD